MFFLKEFKKGQIYGYYFHKGIRIPVDFTCGHVKTLEQQQKSPKKRKQQEPVVVIDKHQKTSSNSLKKKQKSEKKNETATP